MRKNNDDNFIRVSRRVWICNRIAKALRHLHSGDTGYLLRDQIRLVLYYRVICTRRKSNYREINVEIA